MLCCCAGFRSQAAYASSTRLICFERFWRCSEVRCGAVLKPNHVIIETLYISTGRPGRRGYAGRLFSVRARRLLNDYIWIMWIIFNFSLVLRHYTVGFRLGIRIRCRCGYVEAAVIRDSPTPPFLSRSAGIVHRDVSRPASNWGRPAVVGRSVFSLIQS